MKFYRGLNLAQEEIDFIKTNGDCNLDKGAWLMKPIMEQHSHTANTVYGLLKEEPDDVKRYYDRNEKDEKKFGKYVTGCFFGASIYSNHSENKAVVIEIETDIKNILIDGRDFLYYAIPQIINNSNMDKILFPKLKASFGNKILEYIQIGRTIVWENDTNKRFRLVDYICMDKEIINAHYNNKEILIEGRYGTKFLSAFAIIGGIKKEFILDIKDADYFHRGSQAWDIINKYNLKDSLSISDFR